MKRIIPPRFAPRLALAAATLALVSCTSEQVYNAIRDNRIQNCENLPIPQQQACRDQYRTTWEEYNRDREALQTESPPAHPIRR